MLKNPLFRLFLAIAVISLSHFPAAHGADQKNLVYGRRGTEELRLDTYGAEAGGTKPGLVLVHGGAWVEGSKDDWKDVVGLFTVQGYVCFSIDYRLAQGRKNLWPAQLDDVQLAVRWIRAHAKQFGLDPNRLGAMGGSAGGHLASLLGTMDTRDNSEPSLAKYSSRVQCVINMAGPSDFSAMFPPMNKDVKVLAVPVAAFLGAPAEKARQTYLEASPIYHVDKKTVPHLILQGEVDPIVPPSQSERMYKKLKATGIPVKLFVYPGQGHGFDSYSMVKAIAACTAFLKIELKDKAPAPAVQTTK